MMEQTVKYFDEKGLKYEIILVNDGSKDKTWELMQSLITNKYPKHEISAVTYPRNAGKGFAVRTVIIFNNSKLIIFSINNRE